MTETLSLDDGIGRDCPAKRKRDAILLCLTAQFTVLSAGLFLYGYCWFYFDLALIAVNMMFVAVLLYSLRRVRSRLLLLLLDCSMWFFLISRPTISFFRGNAWWREFSGDSVRFALASLYVTLFCLMAGAVIGEQVLRRLDGKRSVNRDAVVRAERGQTSFDRSMMLVCGVLTLVCFGMKMMVGLDKVFFMQGKDYYDYYVSYQCSYPYAFCEIAGLMPYFLCLFLACLPKKRYCYPFLFLYVVSALPNLLIGIRNDIVLALLFSFAYFVMRDAFDGTKHWVGRFERICILVAVPLCVVLLGAYNYIRDGAAVSLTLPELVVDFFYKQGVSFNVLCIAFGVLPDLPAVVPKNYTFGTAIDYIKTNAIARKLFGAQPLGDGNSVYRAVYGNDFSHSMSYVAREDYLEGHGNGSSFILETFADFGYLGMILFALILGVFTVAAFRIVRRYRFGGAIVLMGLTQFLFVPRASATGWISFPIYIQFIAAVTAAYVLSALIDRKRSPLSAYPPGWESATVCVPAHG